MGKNINGDSLFCSTILETIDNLFTQCYFTMEIFRLYYAKMWMFSLK